MSLETLAKLAEADTPKGNAGLVLWVMAYRSDNKGRCWASQRHLAGVASISQRSLRRELERLEAAGWIARDGHMPSSRTIVWLVAEDPAGVGRLSRARDTRTIQRLENWKDTQTANAAHTHTDNAGRMVRPTPADQTANTGVHVCATPADKRSKDIKNNESAPAPAMAAGPPTPAHGDDGKREDGPVSVQHHIDQLRRALKT